jgi:hypothetical protein
MTVQWKIRMTGPEVSACAKTQPKGNVERSPAGIRVAVSQLLGEP